MSRKKDSAALFEVIHQSREKRSPGLTIPDWAKSAAQREAESIEEHEPSSHQAPSASPPAASRPAPSVPPPGGDAGKVNVSLTYGNCLIIAAAVLVLMLGTFFLGRATSGGGPASPGPQQAGLPIGAGNDQTDSNGRAYGKYYLVIQDLMGATPEHRQSAYKIAAFCKAHGVDATVHKQGDTYWVVSLKPFDHPYDYRHPEDPAGRPAAEFARKVEDLGAKYLQSGGKYNFRQRRDGRFDPFYVKVRKTRDQ